MSKGRWVRPAKGVSRPTRIVSVVCETTSAVESGGQFSERVRLYRVHATWSEFRRGKWTPPGSATFGDGDSFHDWLESYCPVNRRTLVVSPLASHTLTLTGFLPRLEAAGAQWERSAGHSSKGETDVTRTGRYVVARFICKGKPDIIGYCVDRKSIVWVSGYQYFDQSDIQLSQAVGYRRPGRADAQAVGTVTTFTHSERAALWLHALVSLSDWWAGVRGGPWAYTVGGLAYSYFRKRLAERSILNHSDVDAGRLETHAIFGGRASVWYVGDVGCTAAIRGRGDPCPPQSGYGPEPGPVTQVDVRSMYPWLLASQWFPVKLLGYRQGGTVQNLKDLLRDTCVIANVRLRARYPEYPFRYNNRIVYPTGTFHTVLCGPELERAVSSDEVESVLSIAHYQRGKPFTAMAESLLEMREAYRKSGNKGWELFVKLLSNSLAGKLAQRRGEWKPRPGKAPERDWGEWLERNACTGDNTRFRSLAGLVFEYTPDPDKRRSIGQVFAYLTSYGRAYMRSVRDHLPPLSCVAQDTDGLWLLPDGVSRLVATGLLTCGGPGSLRTVSSQPAGRWWGPKHYWTPAGWVLAGIQKGVEWSGGTGFLDSFWSNPLSNRLDGPVDTVTLTQRRVSLTAFPIDGTVTSMGWVEPLHLL